MKIFCPSCRGNNFRYLGEIPQRSTFAGKIISIELPRSNLYRCKNCSLRFRWPRLNKEKLDKLYKNGNSNIWDYEFRDREDWKIATYWIKKQIEKGSILDIGCWDGKFLDIFNGNWKLHGIEINSIVADKAIKKGIKIIAKNTDEIKSLSKKFDVTTAFDLIEHVENPLNFLTGMFNLTKKNGLVIISSGNTEALTWKISGSRYWYCSILEHISFINLHWCHFVSKKINLQIEHIKKFSHANKNIFFNFLTSIINIVYLISPSFFRELRKIKNRYLNQQNVNYFPNCPPSWITSKDHIIVIFKKK